MAAPGAFAYGADFIHQATGNTMERSLIDLELPQADLDAIDAALRVLEDKLGGLTDLSAEQRRALPKMGDKSEAFCRQTLTLLALNPQLVPPGLGLEQAGRDLRALEALRSRTHRLQRLAGRAMDSEIALGSDIMRVALEGYALLKRMGRGSGLESLRQELGGRFSRRSNRAKGGAAAAPEAHDGAPGVGAAATGGSEGA